MSGLPVSLPPPDFPDGVRSALVIATTTYEDPSLRRLHAPAKDAVEFATVLADPTVGGFAVTRILDQPAQGVRMAIEAFLTGTSPSDLVLLYLSCHGVTDARRRLHFAATDTVQSSLASTGVDSAWVYDRLEECRARRQVLILDCCFSGAFARGAKGSDSLGLDRLTEPGRGRAVLTASNATEYSFESPEDAHPEPGSAAVGSVFTAALLDGLRDGRADRDGDGFVTVDEAYAYAYQQVRASGAAQTPQRWLSGGEGQIVLSRSPAGRAVIPAVLPESLRLALDSPIPGVRSGAVGELVLWLTSGDVARATTAEQELRVVAANDIRIVAAPAREALQRLRRRDPAPIDVRLDEQTTESQTPLQTGPHEVVANQVAVLRAPGHVSVLKRWLSAFTLAVAISPDGRFVASGDGGQNVLLWDRTNDDQLRALVGHGKWVTALAFSPDGRVLSSGSYDGTVRLWDPTTGAQLRACAGHDGAAATVAFSPDGHLLVSGDNKTVRLWDPTTGAQLRAIAGYNGVSAVAFSPDGRLLAIGDRDTVRFLDPATGAQDRVIREHPGGAKELTFSPDGRLLASYDSMNVHVWNALTLEHLHPFLGDRPHLSVTAGAGGGVLPRRSSLGQRQLQQRGIVEPHEWRANPHPDRP